MTDINIVFMVTDLNHVTDLRNWREGALWHIWLTDPTRLRQAGNFLQTGEGDVPCEAWPPDTAPCVLHERVELFSLESNPLLLKSWPCQLNAFLSQEIFQRLA